MLYFRFLERLSFLDPSMGLNRKGLIKAGNEDKSVQEKLKREKKMVKKARRKQYLSKAVEKLDKDINEL
jgi:hypothetical protein